jgi:hypothetical protein
MVTCKGVLCCLQKSGWPLSLLVICFLLRAKITSSLITFIFALMLSVAFINVQQSFLAEREHPGVDKPKCVSFGDNIKEDPPAYAVSGRPLARAADWNL